MHYVEKMVHVNLQLQSVSYDIYLLVYFRTTRTV